MTPRHSTTGLLAVVSIASAAPVVVATVPAPAAPVTFTKDVAPIVFAHCAVCHRPGESAPFDLLTYDDVRKRGRQIVIVTESGFMPPWLPAPGDAAFRDERRLTGEERAVLRRWVEEGSAEGDPADLPPMPRWTEGWQLGPPDLVVEMDEAFTVPAEGTDVFRNFVLPIPVETARWVRAVELRPGNPKVVHHAVIQIDETRHSSRLDAREPEPGFEGMSMGRSKPPDGHFLGWTPGKVPFDGGSEMAWRLQPGSHLVVQLHMVPSGKPEPVRPAVGLFFADGPPTRRPVVVLLRNDDIDIPPGARDYLVEDSFELPVPVSVTAVYPHAHYLGKTIQGFAVLPDGTRKTLLDIPAWDFNWQDEYRFAAPVRLPAGSTLWMRHTYDNSAENPLNPSQPPRRVVFGERSVDEMGTFTYQLVTDDEAQRERLVAAYERMSQQRFIAYASEYLRRYPHDIEMLEALGSAYLTIGELGRAKSMLEEALEGDPHYVDAHIHLGGLLGLQGMHEEAIPHFEAALKARPDHADTHNNLGVSLMHVEKYGRAIGHLQHAAQLDPENMGAHVNLATALASRGRANAAVSYLRDTLETQDDPQLHNHLANMLLGLHKSAEAIEHYEAALRARPDLAIARFNLAAALAAEGRTAEAEREYRAVLALDPDNSIVLGRLGKLLLRQRRADEAEALFERALEVGEDADAHGNLAVILAGRGDRAGAARHFRDAARLAPDNASYLNGMAWMLSTTRDPAVRDPGAAVKAAERAAELTRFANPSVLDTLAAAYAAAGRYDRAVRTVQAALGLAANAGDRDLTEKLRSRRELYERGEPYLEP